MSAAARVRRVKIDASIYSCSRLGVAHVGRAEREVITLRQMEPGKGKKRVCCPFHVSMGQGTSQAYRGDAALAQHPQHRHGSRCATLLEVLQDGFHT